MAKVNDFDNVLSECLDRLIKGETIEQCLKRYPQHAKDLEPLLITAQETRTAAAINPGAEFRQRAGNEFQEAIRNMPVKKAGSGGFKWQLRWVAPLAALLVLVTGVGTVSAATNALPDSPLYGLKMATESVQMAFTFSDEGKSELNSRFIDYRVEEIVIMAENGNYAQVEQVTERMATQLSNVAVLNSNINIANSQKDGTLFGMAAASDINQVPGLNGAQSTMLPPKTNTASTENATLLDALPQRSTHESMVPSGVPNPVTEIENLQLILYDRYEKNLRILENLLAKAPDILKPALQRAIEVLRQGYDQAIANLMMP
jgi:hypothetical protein